MHLSVIVQQGQHRRPPSAPALPVAKFIFVRKSTKNPPISTASCPFFPQQACLPHRSTLHRPSHRAASPIAPRCIGHRTALLQIPRLSPPFASPRRPHPFITPPHSPLRPSTFSPAPLRTCSMAFPEISKPALSHFPSRAQYIYIMCRKQNCTFLKKKGHNALPICQIALPLQSQNGNKGCQARQNTPESTLDA